MWRVGWGRVDVVHAYLLSSIWPGSRVVMSLDTRVTISERSEKLPMSLSFPVPTSHGENR